MKGSCWIVSFEIEKRRRAYLGWGPWELKSSQWLGVAKLLILQSWKARFYEKLPKSILLKWSGHSYWFFNQENIKSLLNFKMNYLLAISNCFELGGWLDCNHYVLVTVSQSWCTLYTRVLKLMRKWDCGAQVNHNVNGHMWIKKEKKGGIMGTAMNPRLVRFPNQAECLE